jgi:hypothetical protein
MIIKLMYQNKQVSPYITRVSAKKPPKTIIYNKTVFQNLTIVYVQNNPVYQYTEIHSINIEDIELTAVPLKFACEQSSNCGDSL